MVEKVFFLSKNHQEKSGEVQTLSRLEASQKMHFKNNNSSNLKFSIFPSSLEFSGKFIQEYLRSKSPNSKINLHFSGKFQKYPGNIRHIITSDIPEVGYLFSFFNNYQGQENSFLKKC
jgi:hypothetical protein